MDKRLIPEEIQFGDILVFSEEWYRVSGRKPNSKRFVASGRITEPVSGHYLVAVMPEGRGYTQTYHISFLAKADKAHPDREEATLLLMNTEFQMADDIDQSDVGTFYLTEKAVATILRDILPTKADKAHPDRGKIENYIDDLMATLTVILLDSDMAKVEALKDASKLKVETIYAIRERAIKQILTL